MADYIYLLQTRLTPSQQTALLHIREITKAHAMTVFLVGGGVRDLTSGAPIRDLDLSIQGNALELKKDIQRAGGTILGEDKAAQSMQVSFPGGVRLEIGAALSAIYPKPGKPVYKPATILDDLRRRDFTANAMAISLNEGSYGLLMDPLNGIADIENRELRLVSNYGFIEDPSRMIRAVRFEARLGWTMEQRTQQRYENGKAEDYMAALNPLQRAYELEAIFHEEDPLRVLRKLEAEGWAKVLSPLLQSAKANEPELERLRDTVGKLETMGIHPDPSAAYFPLLTAKLSGKEQAALKESFAHAGFAAQIDALDADAKALAAKLSAKEAAAPSEAWKILYSAQPEPVLWLEHSTKSAPLKAKFKAFFEEWSQARQRIPYQLMQEMRITPELPIFDELVEQLFFALMDGKLATPEDLKAFLEPHSPPAPPPVVSPRRRAVKRETKATKARVKKAAKELVEEESNEDGLADVLDIDGIEDVEGVETDEVDEDEPVATKAPKAKAPKKLAVPATPAPVTKPSVKPIAKPDAKPDAKASSKVAAKEPSKVAASKSAGKPAVAAKPAKVAAKAASVKAEGKKVAKPASKPISKSAAKPAAKSSAKPTVKVAAKAAKVSAKPALKPAAKSVKVAAKPVKVVAKAAAKKPVVKPVARKATKAAKPAPKPAVKKAVPAKKVVAKKVVAKKIAKPAPKPAKKPVVKKTAAKKGR
jgi:tRNA nucleotidyltransferase/poly(A) polymerase